jgi:hypothetical protein
MVAKLRGPGMTRAALGTLVGTAVSYLIIFIMRSWYDLDPVLDGFAVLELSLFLAPIGFLIGLGAFDYWFYWAAGKKTVADDHSSHGAHSWRDYFKVNTDHKVIGIQYVVTSFFFFFVGGLFAMLMRAELAQPGRQFVDPNTFNGLFSVHASLLIFLFIIPVFAGLANFVLPLMIGAPDMAFPRLNALSFWMLPLAGIMMLLDGVRAALRDGAGGAGLLHDRGAVRGRVVDRDRAELPGDDHHHARARDELLPDAAARLGELLDVAARRDRDALHRRVAVHGLLRPLAGLQLLRARGPR